MNRLATRQVHLDFHTSELMPNVGAKFSKENFQKALIMGNLNSITVFAKCHHSWCYYHTKVGRIHPELKFDLLSEQIEAAHEIGVKTPIYITVGWSSNDANNHPEWICREKDGSFQKCNYDISAKETDEKPIVSWLNLCPNGKYREYIFALTQEICDKYDVLDGLFYDIVYLNNVCYCDDCVRGMNEKGYDLGNIADAKKYYIEKRLEFMAECAKILRKKHSEATIFFNGGASIYQPWWHSGQTHYEMEDLPTTWGGYDKMPSRAKFFARTGKDYLGMTGKFHTMWGEFGGFKSSNALKYECAAMLTYGARCSVGDQAHPSGEMDMETYRMIGTAYQYVEEIENFCYNVTETTKLGIMISKLGDEKTNSEDKSDEGLVKILLENQLDFDIVLEDEEFSRFDTIILADNKSLDAKLADKLNLFVKNGGGLLLTGDSGLNKEKTEFLINFGAKYIGKSEYNLDYVKPLKKISDGIVKSPVLCYTSANIVKVEDAEIVSEIYEPYFNRTYGHYCSHQNTPNKLEPAYYPGAVKKGRIIYIAHRICEMYFKKGAQFHRDYFINALNLIYNNRVANVKMPSGGRVRFVEQKNENRYILHLLYGVPIQRGITAVIEDLPILYNIEVALKVEKTITEVKMMPQNEKLEYRYQDGLIKLTVPEVQCHQLVVISY